MNILIGSGLIYIVTKCLRVVSKGMKSTSRWLCSSWIISQETREALTALTFASKFDLVTPMTGINFMPTCWNGTLPFVMPHRFKMALLSSAHIDLEDFWGSNRSAAVPYRQWLQINQQQDDMSLWERAELLSIAMCCSWQSDKHEGVEAATDAWAQWCCPLVNGIKTEHSWTCACTEINYQTLRKCCFCFT